MMKKAVTLSLITLGIIYIGCGLMPPRYGGGYAVKRFAQLPILYKGRIKPMDTTARNALLIIHGKHKIKNDKGERISAIEWLMDLTMRSDVADNYKLFYISHPDVLGLFNISQEEAADFKFNFSFNELSPISKKLKDSHYSLILKLNCAPLMNAPFSNYDKTLYSITNYRIV